jgi:hypothetical protein
MDELLRSIVYGTLPVDVPANLSLKDQLEVIRACLVRRHIRPINLPPDVQGWVKKLYLSLR